MDAVQRVQDIAEIVMRNPKEYAVMATLDVQNAFNSASWAGIIQELWKKEISPYLIRVISSYLDERTILIGGNGKISMTCGVPQGSVLGPTLWNLYYDEVLREVVPIGTALVGYANDLAVIVRGESKEDIEEKLEWTINRIDIWMTKRELQLAAHKTEIVVLVGRRTIRTAAAIRINDMEITSRRSVKYLGVHLGHNMSIGNHIKQVTGKGGRGATALARLMPNIGGPKSGKTRILGSVVNSIILYGAPAWKKWLDKMKYRRLLEGVQRKIAIRIASAYRTTSTKAIQVIAGTIPIHLLVKESTYEHQVNRREQKARARENTMSAWQEEWNRETKTAQWTKRLIPEIQPWIIREHGEVSYYLTQFLSGHGRFKSYLLRMKIVENDECDYCQQQDTPEHTVLQCRRWISIRERATQEIGEELTARNIVKYMLESAGKWKIIEGVIVDIMKEKEKEERSR